VRLIKLSIAFVVASDCPEPIEQAEREEGEGIVEAFTDARPRAGVRVLESAREILDGVCDPKKGEKRARDSNG
jgi:hypothetical protein